MVVAKILVVNSHGGRVWILGTTQIVASAKQQAVDETWQLQKS